MPTDADLLKAVVSRQRTVDIANALDLSPDSVRGRVSRAAQSVDNWVEIAKDLSLNPPVTTFSTGRVNAVVDRAISKFDPPDKGSGVFVGDMHVPYTRWDAFRLAVEIIAYIQPTYVSAYNDMFDFKGMGRWEDNRSIARQLWSGDLENAKAVGRAVFGAFRAASPHTQYPAVWGNHDLWLVNYLTKRVEHVAEGVLADWLEEAERWGVLHITPPTVQNVVQLSTNLVWTHGWFVGANNSTVSQNTVKQAAIEIGSRHAPDVVTGHLHRTWAHKVGKATHYSSPCMSDLTPSYMRKNPNWQLGVTVSHWEGDETYSAVIEFKEQKGRLYAVYDGKRFDTAIDRTQPHG